jgi:uncharacterized protein
MHTVAQIWRYPVKSMRGERVDAATVGPAGLLGDRIHALIDVETGKVASGSWRARRWAGLLASSAACLEEPTLDARVPGVAIALPSGGRLHTADPGIDAALTAALGRDVRLGTIGSTSDEVMYGDAPAGTFLDVAPLHLVTLASLARLSELAPNATFDVRRFRPNLVIETGDEVGFVEDRWIGRTIRVGDTTRLRVTGRCPRCVMTVHAQADLQREPEVLQAAARFNGAGVGVYAAVETPGPIQVGHTVAVPEEEAISVEG